MKLLTWAVENIQWWPVINPALLGKPMHIIRKSLPKTPEGFVWCQWGNEQDVALVSTRGIPNIMVTRRDWDAARHTVPMPPAVIPTPSIGDNVEIPSGHGVVKLAPDSNGIVIVECDGVYIRVDKSACKPYTSPRDEFIKQCDGLTVGEMYDKGLRFKS